MTPYEIPANKGGSGPNPPPSTQVASYAARAPLPVGGQPEQQTGFGGLLSGIARGVTNVVQNPLFQAGAGMVNAGAKGLGLGGGLLAAGEAMNTASERKAIDAKRHREASSEQNRALLWNDMMQNPNPAWSKDLPTGALDLARALGPDAGSKLAIDLVSKHASGWLDRAKLDETKRDHDIKSTIAQAQLEEARNTNADRMLTQDTIRRQRQLEIDAAQREAETEAEIFGRPKPAPLPPPAAPVPRQPLPQMTPRRMSDEAPAADPMLIQTQAAVPGSPAQSPGAAVPPATVRIPRNGGEDVSPDVAREWGQKLLSLPKYRSLGQDIIKQAEAAMEPKGGDLEKGTRTEIEKSIVGDVNHLARLNDIAATYKDEYLKLGPRFTNSINSMAEYAGLPVKDADKQKLAEFATFRAKTIANFNLLLKEASGAAVTEQELRRMMLQEPNAEQNGWFSKPDSPTEFMAKLNNSRSMLVSAIARKNYMRTSLSLDDESIAKLTAVGRMPVGLDQMRGIMGQKQAEIERKIRIENPRIKPNEMQPLVRQQMRGIFGI